ncbi:hypothetical protein, partial [Methanosarcina mazei]
MRCIVLIDAQYWIAILSKPVGVVCRKSNILFDYLQQRVKKQVGYCLRAVSLIECERIFLISLYAKNTHDILGITCPKNESLFHLAFLIIELHHYLW